MKRRLRTSAATGFVALLLSVSPALMADAGWLSRLGRGAAEVGEAGAKAGKYGIAALDNAAEFVAKLPPMAKGVPLAAHATPEGHWKFVNKDGDVFTAGTADELSRVTATLAPSLGADGKLALYLSEDTVFGQRARLKDLPSDAELHVVVDQDSYRLSRHGSGGGEKLLAEVRDNLVVELSDRDMFEEAVFQLGRPLNKSNIRVLALEPGGPGRLDSVPRFDPATKTALVDAIDPAALPAALATLKGQTVLVTGRVEGDALHFRPVSGPEQTTKLGELRAAASAGDVNLVILESASPLQPGGRNWLWQKIAVGGLDEALKRASFADFLNALGASRGQLTVSAARDGMGRTLLTAVPTGQAATPLTGVLGDWVGGVTDNVLGNVAVQGVSAFLRDGDRQRELDLRLIPGIPSWIQICYLAGIAAGVLGWSVARGWWARIWPPEGREDYGNAIGFRAAQGARFLAFVLAFLPVAGSFAFFWTLTLQLWHMLTAPFRLFGWLRARFAPKTS